MNVPVAVMVAACCACTGPREGRAIEVVEVVVGGEPLRLGLEVHTEILDHLSPPPGIRPRKGAWLRSTLTVRNESSDTIRLSHGDTGCLVKLHIFNREAPQDLLWENPVGCADIEIAPVLLPGESHTHPGFLMMTRQFVGRDLEPGVHFVEPSVRFLVAGYGRDRDMSAMADTVVALDPVELEFPDEAADR